MRHRMEHTLSLLNTSIRIKLLIAPAVLILALLLIAGLAVNGLNVQADALNQANEIVRNQIALLDQFALLSEQVQSDVYRIAVLRFMELPEEEIRPVQANLEQGVNELKIMYGEISTTWPLDETEQSMLASLKGPMDEFILQATQAVDVVTMNPSFGVLMVRSSTLSYTKFRGILTDFLDYQNEKIERTQLEMTKRINALKMIITILLLSMALAGILIGLVISTRLIARPIQDVTHIMSRLAENDLSFELHDLERKDEIGAMLRAVEVFRDNAIEKVRLDQELRESEEKFSKAFQTSPYAVTITHAKDGHFVEVNDAFTLITGVARAEALAGSSIGLNLWVDEKERERVLRTLRTGQAVVGQEFQFRKKNGEVFTGLFSAQVLQLSQEPCILSSINDITERKQAEQEIKAYSEKLEEMVDNRTHELQNAQEQLIRQERLAALGQLAGSIGHELRNPLGVISNAIYFLKIAQPDANDKIKEYLDIIENETHTSDKIITDLLDFTRIKSVDREAVAVSELIRQTLERYPTPASVEVTLELPPDLPPVHADPQHIVQVLGNLTVNACQAMDNSGQLTLSASAQGDMIAIAVQDSGEGIPPENMSKLFEPLFTTKTKGIGLGLAVSRKLAEANGGRIEVQSEPEKGSTFTLFLPIFKETK